MNPHSKEWYIEDFRLDVLVKLFDLARIQRCSKLIPCDNMLSTLNIQTTIQK